MYWICHTLTEIIPESMTSDDINRWQLELEVNLYNKIHLFFETKNEIRKTKYVLNEIEMSRQYYKCDKGEDEREEEEEK